MSQHTDPTNAARTPVGQQSPLASASVVGNTLIAFTPQVDAHHKTDLLSLLFFAQLRSVESGNDPKLHASGYHIYVSEVLSNLGLDMPQPGFQSHPTSSSTPGLDQVVLRFLERDLPAPEVVVTEAALAGLKATSSDPAGPWALLSGHAVSNTSGCFAVGVADQSVGPDGGRCP